MPYFQPFQGIFSIFMKKLSLFFENIFITFSAIFLFHNFHKIAILHQFFENSFTKISHFLRHLNTNFTLTNSSKLTYKSHVYHICINFTLTHNKKIAYSFESRQSFSWKLFHSVLFVVCIKTFFDFIIDNYLTFIFFVI